MENRRFGALAAILGGGATAASGVLVQTVVQPASTVPDTMWSYPWTADAIVPVSLVYELFHVLVFLGVLGFARSGAAGPGRAARVGTAFALTGTAALFVAELATIPFRHQRIADTGPSVVGAVFALGIVLTAIGFLLAGAGVLRARVWQGWRRYVPLGAGVWMVALLGVSMTGALAAGVAVYGAFITLLGIAMHPRTTPARAVTRATVTGS